MEKFKPDLIYEIGFQAGLGPSLLHVRDTFFCGNRLCADYKASLPCNLAASRARHLLLWQPPVRLVVGAAYVATWLPCNIG